MRGKTDFKPTCADIISRTLERCSVKVEICLAIDFAGKMDAQMIFKANFTWKIK